MHAGYYDGSTQKHFINWFGTVYDRLITFEASHSLYERYKNNLAEYHNVDIIHCGLHDESSVGSYLSQADQGGFISPAGDQTIQTITVDDYMNGGKVTFVALDVEGTELAVLRGAKKTICEYHPTLAISVYHKPEDLYEIPMYIKSLYPNYRLFLRCYGFFNFYDLICYAFDPDSTLALSKDRLLPDGV